MSSLARLTIFLVMVFMSIRHGRWHFVNEVRVSVCKLPESCLPHCSEPLPNEKPASLKAPVLYKPNPPPLQDQDGIIVSAEYDISQRYLHEVSISNCEDLRKVLLWLKTCST